MYRMVLKRKTKSFQESGTALNADRGEADNNLKIRLLLELNDLRADPE